MHHPPMPLELLTAGDWADVAEIHGDVAWVGRMAELGLRTGTRLRILQGGSPCLVQVNGSRLCLRGEQAMQILVRPVPEAVRRALERC